MSLSYPIAQTVEAALQGGEKAARTRYEAEAGADGFEVEALVTDWFKPGEEDVAELLSRAETGAARGFVQVYEDGDGRPVLAVTYWKRSNKKAKPVPKPEPAPKPAVEDDTDDLYFKHGRTKKRRSRRAAPDPNQLDLFKADKPDPPGN